MIWQIAIDGPASAGKSTISKNVAKILGFEHVDTGSMYRAVALKGMNLKINMYDEKDYKFLDETKIDFINQRLFLDGRDVSDEIRTLEVSNNASLCSSFQTVRTKLVHLQQELAKSKNVVMDGRDIGTVVLPDAVLKIYLNADINIRAERRRNERLENSQTVDSLEETIKEIEVRDYNDSNRAISPLAKADDAVEIDSSKLSVEKVVKKIVNLVFERGYKMEKLEQTNNEILEAENTTEEVAAPKKSRAKKVKTEEVVAEAVATEEAPVKKTRAKKAKVEEVAEVAAPAEEAPVVEEVTEVAPIAEEVHEEEVEADDSSVDAAQEVDEAEEVEAAKENIYRELQVVDAVVVEVIEAKPEYKNGNRVVKAKEERVLLRLEDGTEGFLFKKDTAGINEEDDLFDIFLEDDRLQVVIKKIYPDGGKFVFSTVLLKMRDDLKIYDEIIKNHGTFKAKVVKQLAVGYLLKHDEFSCLLPISQVSATAAERENLVGQEIEVAPIRIDYGRIRVIVSQSVASAIHKRADKKAFLETVEVGQVYEGTVKNVESYGAFIEIADGVEGLLHISELDHSRVFKVDKILNPGDKVKVQVIKVENDRVGLSRKSLIPNYWLNFTEGKAEGTVVDAKVLEINNSGIVVELAETVTGFLPKSEFSYDRDVFITDSVNVGDTITAKVIEIDAHKKRIILSKKQLATNPWDNIRFKVGDAVDAEVVKELKDGYKVLIDGLSGYLPKANLTNYNDPIVEGSTIKVRVRVIDTEKTRLVVNINTRNEAPRQAERAVYGKYNSPKAQEKEQLTNSFGDLLEQQLKKFRK